MVGVGGQVRVLSPGDVVVFRRVRAGRVMHVMAMRVVVDTPDRIVLYQAPDTPFKSARTAGGEKVRDFRDWVLTDQVWEGGSLIRLITPGAWHGVDVEFDASGRFEGWSVNFQTPVVRTRVGLDIDDLILDLVVEPDRTWQLKDADDLPLAVEHRIVSEQAHARVQQELATVIDAVQNWKPPFSEHTWPEWRPPAEWAAPLPLPAT
ncbi:DUF402 domain-containing protein [Longispora sp. K20-0274]|uniref:DUF402 domain-containing protein n=1 Tax=Longispora sp. K20-0274 TaxID=3088255 RepID=UPI00399C2066